MKVVSLEIEDVKLIEPAVFGDHRGYFSETYNAAKFEEQTGVNPIFIQDNESLSAKGVLRGMHYQLEKPQGKLVRVIKGSVYDVAVDMRSWSPTFGKWVGAELSAENKRQLWVPRGFAHGFLVTSPDAVFVYKVDNDYAPQSERSLNYADASVGIAWPVVKDQQEFLLADKDAAAPMLADADVYSDPSELV